MTAQSPWADGVGVAQTCDEAGAPTAMGAAVVRPAISQRGKPYRFGAAGPWAFDFSGLALYVFRRAAAAGGIGGGHNARAMYPLASARGLTSGTRPHPGDLVVFGYPALIGIYVGSGRVVSALNPSRSVLLNGEADAGRHHLIARPYGRRRISGAHSGNGKVAGSHVAPPARRP